MLQKLTPPNNSVSMSALFTQKMSLFAGKYVRTSEEKYEDFLYELGLNFILRKAATCSTPSMEITDLGNGEGIHEQSEH